MAFATKYLFKFNSIHGVEHQIHIQKDGYNGAVIQRPLGRSPKLVKKKNGPICGTSLELYAECHVDGEFAEMYTSSPKEWKVLLYRGGTLVWEGFVSPELYSEPSIAPPYDVQIVATDGLGELKLYKYPAQGLKALKTILSDLLSVTGLSLPFRIISQLAVVQSSPSNFFSHKINLDFMEEETYYDVLTRLLDSLHMTITQYKDKWYMVRETDVTMISTGSLEEITISTSGTVSSTSEVVRTTAGQMGVAQMWPIGHLSTKIEPAKRSIKLQMPWHIANMFLNPNMATESIWATNNDEDHPNRVRYNLEGYGGYALGKVYSLLDPDTCIWGQIVQTIGVKKLTNALTISARVYSSIGGTILSPHPRIACWAKFIPTNSANPTMWWYNGAWRDTAPSTIDSLSPESPTDNGNFEDGCVEAASTYEWNITGLGADYAGALQIYFGGDYVRVYAAALTVELYNRGYEDIININNGARGDGETLELIGGRITEDVIHIRAIQGIWLNTSDVADTSFTDSHWITGRDFLSLTALGHAISIADERIRTEGKLDFPSGMTNLPFVLKTTIDHFVETYEWDIAADEVSFSALSLPAVSLTVDSEVVREITGGTSGGSSSGGGGASGGGASMAEVQQWVTAQGYLTGITSAMVVAALGYTPASTADLSSLGVALQAPTLKIYRGYDRDTGSLIPKITPYLRVSHPLIGNTTLNPECVLMVWDKRRGRFRSLDQGGHTQSNYRSGWGELRGKHATTAPLTFSGATITLDDIRQFILNKCVKSPSYSVAQMEAMTLATYEQNTTSGQDFGFRLTYDSTQTAWVVKKRSRLFGIAIRYENPAWANMVVGTAVETTREIQEVPRYIYSEVAPFRVHINRKTSGRTIGIQLQSIIGPVH